MGVIFINMSFVNNLVVYIIVKLVQFLNLVLYRAIPNDNPQIITRIARYYVTV